MKDEQTLILYVLLFLLISCIFYMTYSSYNYSALEFITECNAIHGESNWSVYRLSPWTTYSDEFWDTHPIVYKDFEINSQPYSCFENSYRR